jgi:hypothetical protein
MNAWLLTWEGTAGAYVRPEEKIIAILSSRLSTPVGLVQAIYHQGGHAERKEMIDRDHTLPISRLVELPILSRNCVYYLPRPVSTADLLLKGVPEYNEIPSN